MTEKHTAEFDIPRRDFDRFLQDLQTATGGQNILVAEERGEHLHLKVIWAFREPPAGMAQYEQYQEQVNVTMPPGGRADAEAEF